VFLSETFTRACARLGISIQRARPRTPTDKGIVEATFGAINTLFCQHVAAYTGSNTTLRGNDATGVWTVAELPDLLDEWLLAGWQYRPHDSLRDPFMPRRAMSPNEKYTALVAAAGYLPLTLSGEDYPELLPVQWRQINAYGTRIDYRTYDDSQLGQWRLQHSGVVAKRGLWEVHYDPCDATHVFVRTTDGGSPCPGRTYRWCPHPSRSSPGAMPAGWPPTKGWTTPMRPSSRGSWMTFLPERRPAPSTGSPTWSPPATGSPPLGTADQRWYRTHSLRRRPTARWPR
jgi:hypothetical protein